MNANREINESNKPPIWLDSTLDALVKVNLAAKMASISDSRVLYEVKARLLNHLIHFDVAPWLNVDYHVMDGNLLLLVKVYAMATTRCFHLPLRALDAVSRREIEKRLGSPQTFRATKGYEHVRR